MNVSIEIFSLLIVVIKILFWIIVINALTMSFPIPLLNKRKKIPLK